MAQRHDTPEMERRQHIAARVLCVLMALLVAAAAMLLYTGIGEGSLSTNGVHDSTETVKPNKPFYVLMIGSDSRKGTALYTGDEKDHAQVDQHADVITLMQVDPKKYRLTLVTVPSNTLMKNKSANVPDNGILADTLLSDNPEQVVSAVEDLTGVNIPYYMQVSFTGFEKVVDSLDTVNVDVDTLIRSQDPISAKNVEVKPGKNRELYASGALAFARAWDEYPAKQDAHRQHNVRALEKSIIRKVLQCDEGTAAHLGDVLSDNVRTNMDASFIRLLSKKFSRGDSSKVKIYDCSGPDKTTSKNTDVVKRDTKAWKQLMYVVGRGYNPKKVTYQQLKQREAEKAAQEAAQQQAQQPYADPNTGYNGQQGQQDAATAGNQQAAGQGSDGAQQAQQPQQAGQTAATGA
jgi:LCP family protein required for cell wall assembly